jgi:hypothetical protein
MTDGLASVRADTPSAPVPWKDISGAPSDLVERLQEAVGNELRLEGDEREQWISDRCVLRQGGMRTVLIT